MQTRPDETSTASTGPAEGATDVALFDGLTLAADLTDATSVCLAVPGRVGFVVVAQVGHPDPTMPVDEPFPWPETGDLAMRSTESDGPGGRRQRIILPLADPAGHLLGALRIIREGTGALSEGRTGRLARLGRLLAGLLGARRDADGARAALDRRIRRDAVVVDGWENAPVGLHALGPDGTFLAVNNTELAWLGYAREELEGRRRFPELLAPASRAAFFRVFAGNVAAGAVRGAEATLLRRDGSPVTVTVDGTACRSETGDFLWTRTALTLRPPAGRPQPDAHLPAVVEAPPSDAGPDRALHLERRLHVLLQTMTDAVVFLDASGRVTFANRSASGLLIDAAGSTPSTNEPPSGVDAPPPAFKPLVESAIAGLVAESRRQSAPALCTLHDPSTDVHWELRLFPAADGAMLFVRDVSDTHRAAADARAALERRVALARAVTAAREAEALRIAREIHDDLGQMLATALIELEFLRRAAPASLPDGAGDQPPATALAEGLASVAELLERVVLAVRRIATELRPPLLDALGLAPALRWLARDMGRRSGLTIELAVGVPEPAVKGPEALALFRIAQEALANTVRHARATHVDIALVVAGGEIVLEIGDDGTGPPAEPNGGRGLGLLGMQERARALGGGVRIAGIEPRGTLVTARLPWRGDA
ncbi:PAS domain-containing protein [Myxococcota bacterium]|nr:PAS domain-containing protein [Myxococcota bacterium]